MAPTSSPTGLLGESSQPDTLDDQFEAERHSLNILGQEWKLDLTHELNQLLAASRQQTLQVIILPEAHRQAVLNYYGLEILGARKF